MRLNVAILLLVSCLPVAVLRQTVRQEKAINLRAGVSVEVASVSRAGSLVAAICTDHAVRVWSATSGELVHSLDVNADPARRVEFSHDGRWLAIGYRSGTIKIWETVSWKVQQELAASSRTRVLAFSPDDHRLASVGRLDVQAWDLVTGKMIATISPPLGWGWACSFSPDGRLLATADSDAFVRVYEANGGSLRSTAKDLTLEPMAVVFAPDGKSVLAGGIDKTISIIDVESGKVLRALPKQAEMVWLLDVSADGKQAAAVYRPAERFNDIDRVRLWDVDTGVVLVDFHKPGVTIVGGAFVGDHYLFTAVSANELTLWSIR
jgi:WD40 repeat protein